MKSIKFKVAGIELDLEGWQVDKLLIPEKAALAKKVSRQGGILELGINSIKQNLLIKEDEN